ncbi:hypothetical protein [Nonomuraea jabiensis]|uniref:Uncharacterized protein n=1 Tax=Nonomuraea jabiensis TaxID=882448 RepID=A0A7W9GBU5_9ACTN|nr:hypothetical protein [Nonomuraea jabiensis]MBB5780904.1 hypothetical protein [Nonomuraea jabiensis]
MAGLPPATGGHRITWAEVPAGVRTAIEELLGAEVVGAAGRPAGRFLRGPGRPAAPCP